MTERYGDDRRSEALRLYVEHGAAEASQRTNVAAATVRKWASRAGLARDRGQDTAAACEANRMNWQSRRLELAARTGALAAAALERVRVELAGGEARSAKDYAVTFGVLVDKASVRATGCPDEAGPFFSREEQLEHARARARGLVEQLARRRSYGRTRLGDLKAISSHRRDRGASSLGCAGSSSPDESPKCLRQVPSLRLPSRGRNKGAVQH